MKTITFILFHLFLSLSVGESAGDRFERMMEKVYVPKRSEIQSWILASFPEDSKSVMDYSQGLDRFAEKYLTQYSKKIQFPLKDIYQKGFYIKVVPGMIERQGKYAQAAFNLEGVRFWQEVSVDSDIRQTQLLYRMTMIHEVMVHVGQTLELWWQVGDRELFEKVRQQIHTQLTELTAFAVEKELYDRISMDAFEQDIAVVADPGIRLALRQHIILKKSAPKDDYLRWRVESGYLDSMGRVSSSVYGIFNTRYQLNPLPQSETFPSLRDLRRPASK